MRLIDADALIVATKRKAPISDAMRVMWAECLEEVRHAPTIEPERKKGKWIYHNDIKNVYGGIFIECSECGEMYVVQYVEDEKFCRNCGAYNRGDHDDNT